MKKWLPCKVMAIAMLLTGSNAGAQTLKLKRHLFLPEYSSASAVAWYKGSLFVMGDDAPTLLILNKKLKEQRQPRLFAHSGKRIPYQVKPDLESAAITEGKNPTLWFFPSCSTPARNRAVRMDLAYGDATPSVLTLAPFTTGLAKPNIEGAAFIKGSLILANRANSEAPEHYLLAYDLEKQVLPHTPDKKLTVQLPPTKEVVGISGMHYLGKEDLLLLTVSTEKTATTVSDGTIGNSYLAFVQDAAKQLEQGTKITAQALVPLQSVLKQKDAMKIEGITLIKQRRRNKTLVLAADNDNGTTHLFVVRLKLPRQPAIR